MNKEIKELRQKFKKYDIDGYVIPKNDDYFTEYSKINRLKIISNFSGSAGLAIVLKDKNYLFTDGRYTIQSEMESGKHFTKNATLPDTNTSIISPLFCFHKCVFYNSFYYKNVFQYKNVFSDNILD